VLQAGYCNQTDDADAWRLIKLNNTVNNTSMWAIVLGANNEFIACWDTGDGLQDPYKKIEHPLLKKPFPASKLPSIMGCGWRKVTRKIHHHGKDHGKGHVKDHDKGHIKGHDLRAMATYVARAMPRAMERGMVKAIRRFPGQAKKTDHHGKGHHLRAARRAMARAMARGMVKAIRRFPGQAKKIHHHGKGHKLRAATRSMVKKAILRSFARHGKGLKKSRRHRKD